MSMNDTPSSGRVHIAFFGRRNAGKSSLVNAVTGQNLAVVSAEKGTTTDPVQKSMELLPMGPVVIIDTPGFDDEGELGALRVEKTRQVLDKADVAVLVADATQGLSACEEELLGIISKKNVPYLLVLNKCDLVPDRVAKEGEILVSALTGAGIYELKEAIARLNVGDDFVRPLLRDLLLPGRTLLLVTPIDSAAPKGRMILPQQQAIRDGLDAGAPVLVVRETELVEALHSLREPPCLVVTDSQAFERVNRETPPEIPLTSFSILMARMKGILEPSVQGVTAIDRLQDGDRVLVAEGCTHHRQCGDIGTIKIPKWLRERTGKELTIQPVSGTEFPQDVTNCALVIHCGGCMLTPREMRARIARCQEQGVPVTNYGTAIAYMKGILPRSLQILPEVEKLLHS